MTPHQHQSHPERAGEQQLADLAELVGTGRVDLGAFTQAEMAVVLGGVPALAGVQDAVLAEAVRSLAARGVLHRVAGEASAEIVGDLGLLAALVATRTTVPPSCTTADPAASLAILPVLMG